MSEGNNPYEGPATGDSAPEVTGEFVDKDARFGACCVIYRR